jgi:hypothetical protein
MFSTIPVVRRWIERGSTYSVTAQKVAAIEVALGHLCGIPSPRFEGELFLLETSRDLSVMNPILVGVLWIFRVSGCFDFVRHDGRWNGDSRGSENMQESIGEACMQV